MKKVLTAIGNPMLNNKFKEHKDYEVLTNDLEKDTDVIEWLQKEKDIDFLIVCSNVINNYNVDEFIDLVKTLQENISIILFKEKDIESSVKESENVKIYTNPDINWEILEKILQKKIHKNIRRFTSKIIAVSGCSGIGKSTFSTFFAKSVEDEKIKTLLIDFDLDENNIRTILKIKPKIKKAENIKDMIVNIDKNVDVLCDLDKFFVNKDNISFLEIKQMLNELKQEYNYIIIDTSSKFNDYTKNVIYNSDEIIFLVESNILGVKKAKNILEIFEYDWKISYKKMKIVLNKANMYELSESIIEELFPEIKVIGKIKYNDSYNLLINKDVYKKEVKKEYQQLQKII